MAARGQRWGSKYRVETGPCIARSRVGVALRLDHDHDDRFRPGKQECAAVDRSDVHAARLLADHATGVFCNQAGADCARRSRSLAKPCRMCTPTRNSHDLGKRALVAEIGEKVSTVPIFHRANISIIGSGLRTGAGRCRSMGGTRRCARPESFRLR